MQIDPYAIAWKRKVQSKIVADTVGYVPQEISRFVFYFLERGGSLSGTVHSERYVASPIPKGGLEIIIDAQFSMDVEKRRYLERLMELIKSNYVLNVYQGEEEANNEVDLEIEEVESVINMIESDCEDDIWT